MTKILVAKEKHGDRYFTFDTPEEQNRIALKLVRERAEYGYYPSLEDIERDEADALARAESKLNKEYLELSDEEVELLPESIKLKAIAEKERFVSVIERVKRSWAAEKEFAQLLSRLLKSDTPEDEVYTNSRKRDFRLASYILDLRRDGEYEGIEIESGEEY